jgi:hypothetical protein
MIDVSENYGVVYLIYQPQEEVFQKGSSLTVTSVKQKMKPPSSPSVEKSGTMERGGRHYTHHESLQ